MEKPNENTSAPGGYVYSTPSTNEKVGTSMRHSSPGNQIQQQQETIASEIATETLQDVAYARVDPYTLEIIQQIFPAPNKGLEFVARILRFAQIVQNVLPGLEDMGEQVAVINVPTIRILAKWIDWGYDTTHKYVITFCALGLLRKNKQNNERQLIFPLDRYILPTNVQPLDNLIAKSRPKVQQFARQVKGRLSPLNATAQAQTNGVNRYEVNDGRFRDTIYQSLFHVIESEGIDPIVGRHLSKRIITEVLSQFDVPQTTMQAHEKPYRQIATGTTDNRRAVTQPTVAQTTQYESTRYPFRSTLFQEEYARHQAKYAYVQTESTPRRERSRPYDIKVSEQGRLHNAKVSLDNKIVSREVSPTIPLGETLVDWSRFSTPKVSSRHAEEDTRPHQEQQPVAPVQQETHTSPHKMISREILSCYENILRNNLVDWGAVGLSTEFIERLYQELYTVYTDLCQKKLTGTSGFFFKTLEKRFINRLADEYRLDYTGVHNVIMYYTNREQLMIEEPKQPQQPQPETVYAPTPAPSADYPNNSYQDTYNETQAERYSRANKYQQPVDPHAAEYQYPVDPHTAEYQQPVDPHAEEYQYPIDPHAAEYQYPVNPHIAEYQQPVDPHAEEYQYPIDPHAAAYQHPVDSYVEEYQQPVDPREVEYQHPVDLHEEEYQHSVDSCEAAYQQPVDLKSGKSTKGQAAVDSRRKKYRQPLDSGVVESAPQEDTQHASADPRKRKSTRRSAHVNVSITDIVEKSILDEGKTYLRIPQKLDIKKYSPEFCNVYVTSDLNLLFNIIYNNTTLRNDAKMFFAEIFDTNRSSTAKSWYSKLFSKCSNAESLLAGFIETTLDLHSRGNKSIKNPGGLFNKKCAECEDYINDNTREHINTYSKLPYEEFVLEIARFAQREHNNNR